MARVTDRHARLTALLAALRQHGGFTSETRLAKAFDVRQSTLTSWKDAKRQTSTERDFLRAYAHRFRLDPGPLLEQYALRPAPKATAKNGARPAPTNTPVGKLLARVENCVVNDGPGGPAWTAIEAVLDVIEHGRQ